MDEQQAHEVVEDLVPDPLVVRRFVLQAIDDEPEFTDEMPDEMRTAMLQALETRDVDVLAEVLRMTVRMTKQGIRECVEKLTLYPYPSRGM